jgi:hypothetical protein
VDQSKLLAYSRNDLVRDAMILSGRSINNMGLREAGDEIMGQMELLDCSNGKMALYMPNARLPAGGPYIPANHLPTLMYQAAKQA